MSDYRATIANCPLRGIEFTQHTANGHPARTRNLIRLKAGGFDLELTQDLQASANVAKLIGNAVDTTDLLVRNVAPSQVARLQEVIMSANYSRSPPSLASSLIVFNTRPDRQKAAVGRWWAQFNTSGRPLVNPSKQNT